MFLVGATTMGTSPQFSDVGTTNALGPKGWTPHALYHTSSYLVNNALFLVV